MLGSAKQAFGGQVTNVVSFTTSGSWTAPSNLVSAQILLVGGGGGGGVGHGSPYCYAGGGGAGGVIITPLSNLTPGLTYTITVGTGGTGAGNVASPIYYANPTVGSNSQITGTGLTGLVAVGGGYGGAFNTNPLVYNGYSGGSGGGGAASTTLTTTNGNVGISGQGYNGGTSSTAGSTSGFAYWGGGGGGAGGLGGSSFASIVGGYHRNGGSPLYSEITGANVAYAEGGGGAVHLTTNLTYDGYTSTAYGSGGGAGGYDGYAGTNGQPGIVIIQYRTVA